MKILLDFDETINQMTHHWVNTLNCVYRTSVNYEGSYIKILFDKPWNKKVDKSKLTDIIHRIHNWDEIIKFINLLKG